MLVKMWRKDKPYILLLGKHIDTITVKISMDVSQKTKNTTTIWPSNSASYYISEKKTKTLIWKDICTPKFIAVLFSRVTEEICVHQQMNDKYCVWSTNIHNGILLSQKRMKLCHLLESIMLNEISQRQRQILYVFHLYVKSKKKNTTI